LFLTAISLVLYILKIFAVNLGYTVSFFYIVSVPKSNSNGTVKFPGIYERYRILLMYDLILAQCLLRFSFSLHCLILDLKGTTANSTSHFV